MKTMPCWKATLLSMADGTKVYEGLDAEIAVDGGVYIVVTADVVNKVVVR